MDNEIQDKYMDAVLAMLMDEYAEAEAEMLLQNSKDEIPEVEMPEELASLLLESHLCCSVKAKMRFQK